MLDLFKQKKMISKSMYTVIIISLPCREAMSLRAHYTPYIGAVTEVLKGKLH